ncbi:MAG: RNA methyltransferase [Chloroflexota bacterium]|nr:RNA methyltransferase [Chloroflexota bacterium]
MYEMKDDNKPSSRRPPKAQRAHTPRQPSPAYLERRRQGIGEGNPNRGPVGEQSIPTTVTPRPKPPYPPRPKTAAQPPPKAPRPPVQAQAQPEPVAKIPGIITSQDNDKARFLRNLLNKRDRYAAKHFMVEGVRLVSEAFASPFKPLYTLYDPEMLGRTELGQVLLLRLIELYEDKKGVYPTTERIIASLSDTVTPQGVAAAVPFIDWKPEELAAKKFHLVLDGLQDPGNLGTILRSAGAAGNAAIWLTEGTVDLYSPKVVRAGMGAHFRVPSAYGQKWPELLQQFEALGIEQIFLAEGDLEDQPDQGRHSFRELSSVDYFEVDWKKPTAVVVGNEAHGPGVEAWRNVSKLVNIPMPGGAESLNASVAASIILFEALRQQLKD